eukprot:1978497-Amphidinium_carterae.1
MVVVVVVMIMMTTVLGMTTIDENKKIQWSSAVAQSASIHTRVIDVRQDHQSQMQCQASRDIAQKTSTNVIVCKYCCGLIYAVLQDDYGAGHGFGWVDVGVSFRVLYECRNQQLRS